MSKLVSGENSVPGMSRASGTSTNAVKSKPSPQKIFFTGAVLVNITLCCYFAAEGSHDSTIELPPVKVLDCPANDPYYEESGQCERWGIAMGKCGRIRDKSDMMARKCPTTCCENLKALGI